MRGWCRRNLTVALLLAFAAGPLVVPANTLEVPPGYRISVYADGVTNARQLALGGPGLLFVGSRDDGAVRVVLDSDGDFVADEVRVLASDLNMPSGVAWHEGDLYIAEVHRITRIRDVAANLDGRAALEVVYDALPTERHHGWKFIAFGPDGRLYIPIGAPCNVCDPDLPFASIMSLAVGEQDLRLEARGVRNSVGFDWHPGSGDLWFSDNGRDWLGDDRPPGEINRRTARGQHFGYPYLHGANIRDPEFGDRADGKELATPALLLGAHVAPLGIEFYRGTQFPVAAGTRALFVAEHGSWNRSSKAGYRVMRATVNDDGRVSAYEPFVSGWLRGQAHSGRPADVEMLPDGSLLIADDYADRIYRVTWEGR